jgi:hypothetical protein
MSNETLYLNVGELLENLHLRVFALYQEKKSGGGRTTHFKKALFAESSGNG